MSISLPHPRAARRSPAALRHRRGVLLVAGVLVYLATLGVALALYADVVLGIVVPAGTAVVAGSYVAAFTSRPRR